MKKETVIKSIASDLGISKNHVRPVDEFPGYFVTDCGKIISYLWGKPLRLKSQKVNSGYNRVLLRKDGKSHPIYIHHLVLKNFAGEPPVGYRAHFKDRNKDNMSLGNLKWRQIKTKAGAQNYQSNRAHIPDAVVRKAMRLSRKKKTKALRRLLTGMIRR